MRLTPGKLVFIICVWFAATHGDKVEPERNVQDTILQEQYGVGFQPMGSLDISPHLMTLNFMIPFRNWISTPINLPPTVTSVCSNQNISNNYIGKICNHQLPSLYLYLNISKDWERRIENLQHYYFLGLY